MSVLNVATIQTELHWENTEANLNMLTQKLAQLKKPVDVLVLPEMFTTGFSMNTALAETPDGTAMQWMQTQAAHYNMAICGSLMMRDKHDDVYNRFIWMNPEGTYYAYNKRHLFSIGHEHLHFKPGQQKLIITYKNFHIQLLVCYDLRFPVWIRRTPKHNYDAIFIVANWPERRAEHWKTLLKARAIENQCYVVAVNRIGVDGNGVNHSGDSSVIDSTGQVLYTQPHQPELAIHVLNLQQVKTYRADFAAQNDADQFTIQL